MAAASIKIEGSITGTLSGTRVVGPITLTSATANGQVQQIVLQAGANTITVPTTPAPSGCIIILPATNTSVTTLKGISGDTGIAIGKVTTQVLHWDATAVPASFVLSSVSTQTGLITEIIFF
jgi:hypothetical protein